MKAEECGANCQQCPLKEMEYVPPEINPASRTIIVGNYPTDHEVRASRPFVGPAGNELVGIMRQIGWNRGDVDWTTVVCCKPPDNDMKKFLAQVRKRNRTIDKENRLRKQKGEKTIAKIPMPQDCCKPRLDAELKKHNTWIIAGTQAAKACIHSGASVMELRGSPTEIERDGRTIQVLPTFHPAMVQQSPRWKEVWENDLRRAYKWFNSGLRWQPPTIYYHPKVEDLRRFLFNKDVPYYTYDIETDGIEALTANIRCIGIGTPKEVVLIGYRGINGRDMFYTEKELKEVNDLLCEFFEDESILKCGHNAGYYDRIVVEQQLGVTPRPLIDTMLMHRLVASELPHSLGFLGSVYTEAPSWKTDRQGRKKAYGSETDFELHEYCGYDVGITAEVVPALIAQVKSRGQMDLMTCDHKLQEICSDMHTVGMFVDQEKRHKLEKEMFRSIHEQREKIQSLGPTKDINPGSPIQVRELLFEKWQLDPPVDNKVKFTDTGDISTGDPILRALLTLRSLTEEQREVITQIRRYKKTQKLLGTYVTKLRYSTEEAWGGWDEDDSWMDKATRDKYGLKKLGIVNPHTGRMYPGYNAHVTTTGRLSSSRPMNAQNFPKHMRGLVRAQPGHIFVGADADQLELRIAASRWNSQKYLEAFENGLDPHSSVTAYTVFGKRFEDAAIECGCGPYPWKTGTKFSGTADKLRQLSKIIQYASQYSASVDTVHRVITQTEVPDPDRPGYTLMPYAKMSVREVRIMHEKWCEGAQFNAGWDREIQDYRNNGYLIEPVMGRRRDFLDGENINEIVNFPIQASGASLMNMAIIDLHERIPLYKWGVGTGIINQCHDSIVVECPESEAEWVKEQIEDAMNLTHVSLRGVTFTAAADIAMTWDKV